MKKLLSILGVLELSSLGINSVIACKGPELSPKKQPSDDNEQTSNSEEQEPPAETKAPVQEEKDEDKTGDIDKEEITPLKRNLRYDISRLSFDNSLWNYKINNIWNYKFDDELENEIKTEINNKFLRKLTARSVSMPSELEYTIQKVNQIDHEFSKELIFAIEAESTPLKIKWKVNEIKFNFRQKNFIEFFKYSRTNWTLLVGNNEHVSTEEVNEIVASIREIVRVSKLEKAGFKENKHYEIKNLDQIQPGDLTNDIVLTVAGKQGSVLENLWKPYTF